MCRFRLHALDALMLGGCSILHTLVEIHDSLSYDSLALSKYWLCNSFLMVCAVLIVS